MSKQQAELVALLLTGLKACRDRIIFELSDTYGGTTEAECKAMSPGLREDWEPHLTALKLADEAIEAAEEVA